MKAPKTAIGIALIILFGLSIVTLLTYQTLVMLSLIPTQTRSRFQIASFKPPTMAKEVLAASSSAIPSSTISATLIATESATPSAIKKSKPSAKPKAAPASVSDNSTNITPLNVLTALNNYRQQNGKPSLILDHKLHEYAQTRSDYFLSQGKMDNHQAFNQFMDNNGFSIVKFNSLAENSSAGFTGTSQELIEQLYGKSSGHNNNQLSTKYTHVGIGVSGQFTDIVFGGSPL